MKCSLIHKVIFSLVILLTAAHGQSPFAGRWQGPVTSTVAGFTAPAGTAIMDIDSAGNISSVITSDFPFTGSVTNGGQVTFTNAGITSLLTGQINGGTMTASRTITSGFSTTFTLAATRSGDVPGGGGGGGNPTALPDPGNLTTYRGRNNEVFLFQVTGSNSGGLWGTDIYTDDSTLAKAVVHAGVLNSGESGVVEVIILPGQNAYPGTSQNGIASSTWGTYSGSFSVAAAGNNNPVDFTIDSQPLSQSIPRGESVTFTIAVTGTDLTYQWFRGSAPDRSAPVTGATNSSLSVNPTSTESYWVEITNPSGSRASNTFTATVIESPRLIAHYTFDDPNLGSDRSSSGLTVTVAGNVTSEAGRYGDGVRMNASGSLLRANVGDEFQTNNLTLMAWVKPDASGNANPRIIGVGPASTSLHSYSLILNGTGSPRAFDFFGHLSTEVVSSTTQIPNDDWAHLAVTYDGTTVRHYFNGTLDRETTSPGMIKDISATGVLVIGNSDLGFDWFQGIIDEVKIYNYALDESAITTALTEPAERDPSQPFYLNVSAKANGGFGTPVSAAEDFVPVATFTETNEQVIISADGKIQLTTGEALPSGPDGVEPERAVIAGHTALEERELDLGNITLGDLPGNAPQVGALIGVFIPAETAARPGFRAFDNDTALDGVDSSDLIFVGSGPFAFVAPGPGTLYLGINEPWVLNNSGSFRVTIDPLLSEDGLLLLNTPAGLVATWSGTATLQSSPNLKTGSWTDLPGITAPYSVPPGGRSFLRIKR